MSVCSRPLRFPEPMGTEKGWAGSLGRTVHRSQSFFSPSYSLALSEKKKIAKNTTLSTAEEVSESHSTPHRIDQYEKLHKTA